LNILYEQSLLKTFILNRYISKLQKPFSKKSTAKKDIN